MSNKAIAAMQWAPSWGIMKYFVHWSRTMWSMDSAQSRIGWFWSCCRACLMATFFARALLPMLCCSGFARDLLGICSGFAGLSGLARTRVLSMATLSMACLIVSTKRTQKSLPHSDFQISPCNTRLLQLSSLIRNPILVLTTIYPISYSFSNNCRYLL